MKVETCLYGAMALFCLLLSGAAFSQQLQVKYDAQADTLSVTAVDVLLSEVLSEVADQSNLSIFFDSRADRLISMTLPVQALERSLKQLVRQHNSIFQYDDVVQKNGDIKLRITGLKVLPEGVADASNLKSLSELNRTAQKRAAREARTGAASVRESRKAARADKKRKNEQQKAKRKEERHARRMKRLEELRISDPEKYERRMAKLKEKPGSEHSFR